MSVRPLVVAAHGTASKDGQAVVQACAARATQEAGLAGPPVVGYVDVCGPTLSEVLEGLTDPVVVPLFLATGFHVREDIPAALESVAGATATPALGTAQEVVAAVTERVRQAWADAQSDLRTDGAPDPGTDGRPDLEAVLVVGAGSSVDQARAEVARVADLVGRQLSVATGTGFLSGPGARAACELTKLRLAGHTRIVVAAHLLSPGYFLTKVHRVAEAAGAVATAPLGTHDLLSDLVARRYREA